MREPLNQVDVPLQPVWLLPGYDHSAGDLVDVFRQEDGEFVQVWNMCSDGSFDSQARVVLSYRRTSKGVDSVSRYFSLAEGPFSGIEVSGLSRTFHYRDNQGDTRHERELPSGRVLIDDPRQGLYIRKEWSSDFNWEKRLPIGTSLDDSAVIERQSSNMPYFVSYFQDASDPVKTKSSRLMAVEAWQGRVLISTTELVGRFLDDVT